MNIKITQNNTKHNDPYEMDLSARIAFKKVYPFLAKYIVNNYGISEGRCLDLGSGPGSLSIAMAKNSSLNIIALDISSGMSKMALNNIDDEKLSQRILPITADVHQLPFQENSFDIVISRGSIFFWDNRPQAFYEIHRVLKPGGIAFCGGGMGSEEIRQEADNIIMNNAIFRNHRRSWQERNRGRGIDIANQLIDDLKIAGISGNINRDCQGIWVEIKKHIVNN